MERVSQQTICQTQLNSTNIYGVADYFLMSFIVFNICVLIQFAKRWNPEAKQTTQSHSEWKIWDLNTDPQMWNLGFFLLCVSRLLWKNPQVTLIDFKRQITPQHFTWLKQKRINWLRRLRGRKRLQALAKVGKKIGSLGDSLFTVYFQISHLCFLC